MPQHRHRRRKHGEGGIADLETPIQIRPTYVDVAQITAANAVQIDTPPGARHVMLEGTDTFYATFGSTDAAVPGATVTGGNASELGPTTRNIGSTSQTTGLTLAAGNSCTVTLAWYT